MSNQRPAFEKKELDLSGSPYLYLPVEFPAYAVEVTHADEVDGDLLQKALDRTLKRMPYLADTLQIEGGAVYYATDPLPMEVGHVKGLRHVGGAETNYHMLDVTYDGHVTWFAMFHGFCDGLGLCMLVESVLYHYYCMKDGVEYDACGIRSDAGEASPEETLEPLAEPYELPEGFQMPQRGEQAAPYHLPDIVPPTDAEVRDYGLRLSSAQLMDFVKACGASPTVIISMMVGEAIERMHPDADAPIVTHIPISYRRMLGCEETFKNCASRAMLPLTGTPMDAMPFEQRAAALRGALKQQLDPTLRRAIQNFVGGSYRQRMAEATDYWEETKKPQAFMTVEHDTFYTDYIGSLHKTAYSGQMTNVRFLCRPAASNTLHLNVIEHDGRFLINCLACCDITPLVDTLVQVMEGHGLDVDRADEQRFTLPPCAWREGVE